MQGRVPPGKASRLLPKSGHRPVMRLVEDSLPIPSGVGTNKESRKQLPAIRRSTTFRSACKGRSAYSLRWQSSPLDANCRINTRQYRSAFFDRRSPDQNWKDIPAPEGLAFLHVGRRYRLEEKIRTAFFLPFHSCSNPNSLRLKMMSTVSQEGLWQTGRSFER